jgi:Fe-S oxidoreductase
MCPSYQATRNEKDTTRARANTLREFLTKSDKVNKFDHEEIKQSMDLCLSCKGCSSECPSNVDMSSLKAEFLHQYYQSNGIPLRAKAFAYINKFNKLGSIAPRFYNFFLTNSVLSGIAKSILQVAEERRLPTIQSQSLRQWYKLNYKSLPKRNNFIKSVILFCDEFTNWNDTDIGIKGIKLLHNLGYEVVLVDHEESGRAALSKGLLPYAKKVANKNIKTFSKLTSSEKVLIGIEPSAILTFRDEYPRLVDKGLVESAKKLKENTFLIDEFISAEIQAGNISSESFTKENKDIILHGHCHQKALSNIEHSVWCLSLPENYSVELLPTGCCGMAGSFGYEKEHYDISQQIGELVLFPAIRNKSEGSIIAATGTSCRHQIADGTESVAMHPIEILWDALANN